MAWWGWMILGAALLATELLVFDAQFYLVFFGVSAAIVGLASLSGVPLPAWGQWLAFAILALLSFVSFRGTLYRRIRHGAAELENGISGGVVAVKDALPPGGDTRAEYRGTEWAVRNVGEHTIQAGARGRIVGVEGLTLHVVAE